jgi:4-diphosphocytidyl-2-C-methyl-D-erythritol kinase
MIIEKAYAKINLTLDVVGKRIDGYHELKMIMIPIDFFDELTFEKSDKIELISNIDIKDNAILKTAKKMQETFGISEGVKITLNKKIPIGAGLAGGSADIAATIRGLNLLWNINLPLEALKDIALSLGSDTLFCLYNQPAYVYGRGEHIEFINQLPIESIYLFTSNMNVSTKEVFGAHKISHKFDQFPNVFQYYLNENTDQFIIKTYNHLTKTTFKLYPELKNTYKKILAAHKPVHMSGSGSTLYILSFKSNDELLEAKIRDLGLVVIKTKPKT